MKNNIRITTFCLLAGGWNVTAAPLVSIGDSMDLYFNGSATIRYSDNLFLRDDQKESDTVFIFSPGLELAMGKRGAEFTGNIRFQEDIDLYLEQDGIDNTKANLFANGRYDTGVFKFDAGLSFREMDQATQDLIGGQLQGKLVEREVTSAYGYAEYTFSQLLSFGAGLRFDHTFFQTYERRGNPNGIFSDYSVYTVPVDLFWKYSEKLDFSVGYQYRLTDISHSIDTEDNFYNIGIRGEITPKITGRIQAGYTNRTYDLPAGLPLDDEEDSLTLVAGLNYQFSPKLNFGLTALRDFGTSGGGTSIEQTSISINGNYEMGRFWYASARFSYRNADYNGYDREDDTYDIGLNLSYRANEFVSLSAGYIYMKNDSSENYDFSNNVVQLSASLRY